MADKAQRRRAEGADFPSSTSSRRGARIQLSVQRAVREAMIPKRAMILQWLRAACPPPIELTVRFVGEAEGRQLNYAYRGKDYATNVLSFPYDRVPIVRGDLVLCVPVVLREAAAQGKAVDAHFAHLIVHGLLHLLGFDHETEAEAAAMEARESAILARLGLPDPYLETCDGC